MTISLRPRPHHPVLRRSVDAVQFGIGPGGSVEVRGGDPELHRMLLGWHGDRPVDDLVRCAVEAGIAEPVVRSVLDELCRAGALVDSAHAARVLAERSAATVLVTGDGPLLPGVASALAASGVGRLAVAASGVVLAEDVGGYDHADRGHPRTTAAVRAVHRVVPDAHCTPRPPRGRVDLVVLTDRLHPGHRPPDAPHLLVRLVDGLGLVGPLVLPGRTACLRCLDLHLAAADPCWPTVAAALVGLVGTAGPATVAATAALAAEQALTALDASAAAGPPPPTLDGVLELDTRRGGLRRRHWPPHPGCSCGAGHRDRAGLSRRGPCGEPEDGGESCRE